MDRLGTVLGVWAHPDDESYLSSGLMARAARQGERVVCLTATRGEGGSLDEERWPTATLAGVRERELLSSLALLGVEEHHFLDLPDIGMSTPLPEGDGPERVRELMAEVRPRTVVTFGPDGITGHAAHISVGRWAAAAFEAAAPPGARLLHACYARSWADRYLADLTAKGVFDRPPPVVADDALGLHCRLDPAEAALKVAALKEHRSQVEWLFATFSDDYLAAALGEEAFALAATKP